MSEHAIPRYYSRLLKRIESEIRSSTKPKDILALRAHRAALIALSSDVGTAKKLVLELREINKGYEPRLASWIMYCDGIIHYSESYDLRSAYERIRRANIFAGAVKDAELAGLCAAWMAYFSFSQGEPQLTADYLVQALTWALPNRLTALSRAYLTLADSMSWAGLEDDARKWYHRARLEAAHQGDIVMQDSVIFNSAAFRVSNVTLMECERIRNLNKEKLAETELFSGVTLNTLIGNTSNRHLTALVRGELFAALQRWPEAIEAFEELFTDFSKKHVSQTEPKMLAHYAYCLARIGNLEKALALRDSAISMADKCRELDDLAVLHFRASQVCSILGKLEREEYHLDAFQFALNNFRDFQAKFQLLLQPAIELANSSAK